MSIARQPSRRKRWLYILVGTGLLCLITALLLSVRVDPHFREVKWLVSQLPSSGQYYQEPDISNLRALARLGPKAYPALARLLQVHDTKLDELYDRCWAGFPDFVRRLLPRRESKNDLCARAQAVIAELGPTACRALVGPIHDSLARPDAMRSMGLLRSLYWSIPESSKAVATLHDWLAKPNPRRSLFGMKDADEIWPQVPQFDRLLAPWLRFADHAREAAEGLGDMGTNAAFAIPDLIDTFDNAVASHPPNTNLVNGYAPSMQPLTWNRGAAIQALGRIGVATPRVLATLERGWNYPDPTVRALAADAVGNLGAKALPHLPNLLAHLDTSSRRVLEYQLEAIGKMGPGAREAIPVLRHWADPTAVASLPPLEPIRRAIRWFDDPLPLPGCAAVALFQVAPEEAEGLGAIIAQALSPAPDGNGGYTSRDRLQKLRPLAGEIVPALAPALADKREWVRRLTAYQILCLEPDYAGGRTILASAMQQGDPTTRAQAAIYYWRITGETNQVLPVFRETLATVKDNQSQPPLNYAAELGPVAKSFVPQIQALLTNEDWSIRQLAGKALRRIDPSALPPINEGYP